MTAPRTQPTRRTVALLVVASVALLSACGSSTTEVAGVIYQNEPGPGQSAEPDDGIVETVDRTTEGDVDLNTVLPGAPDYQLNCGLSGLYWAGYGYNGDRNASFTGLNGEMTVRTGAFCTGDDNPQTNFHASVIRHFNGTTVGLARWMQVGLFMETGMSQPVVFTELQLDNPSIEFERTTFHRFTPSIGSNNEFDIARSPIDGFHTLSWGERTLSSTRRDVYASGWTRDNHRLGFGSFTTYSNSNSLIPGTQTLRQSFRDIVFYDLTGLEVRGAALPDTGYVFMTPQKSGALISQLNRLLPTGGLFFDVAGR